MHLKSFFKITKSLCISSLQNKVKSLIYAYLRERDFLAIRLGKGEEKAGDGREGKKKEFLRMSEIHPLSRA